MIGISAHYKPESWIRRWLGLRCFKLILRLMINMTSPFMTPTSYNFNRSIVLRKHVFSELQASNMWSVFYGETREVLSSSRLYSHICPIEWMPLIIASFFCVNKAKLYCLNVFNCWNKNYSWVSSLKLVLRWGM